MNELRQGDELELYFENDEGKVIAVFEVITTAGESVVLKWTSTRAMSLGAKNSSISKIINSENGTPRLIANTITMDRGEILSRSKESPDIVSKMEALYRNTKR